MWYNVFYAKTALNSDKMEFLNVDNCFFSVITFFFFKSDFHINQKKNIITQKKKLSRFNFL